MIVGNGDELENLKRLTKELCIEHFVEFHTQTNDDELLRCYQLCDLFILANRQIGSDIEGFGMVLLEAAACGKATITGTSGGTQEAIAPDVAGLAIDASDIDQIADAIARLYQNSEQRELLGKAGRQRAVTEYDWDNVVRQFLLHLRIPKLGKYTRNRSIIAPAAINVKGSDPHSFTSV